MIEPKDIKTEKEGAIYKVPFFKVTENGLELVSHCPFHFVKGDKSDDTKFRQQGFTTETLLEVSRLYLEDVNIHQLHDPDTSSALAYIELAIESLERRAAKRKAAGTQGTYKK